MGTELQTYAFNSEELSFLLKLSLSSPSQDSPLAQVSSSAESTVAPVRERLIHDQILESQGDILTSPWKEILEALADPLWEITLAESQRLIPCLSRYYPLRSRNQYLGFAQVEPDLYHLSFFHSPPLLLKELTGLLPGDTTENQSATVLPFGEFIALLSIMDIFRTIYLESYIERCPDFIVEFTPNDLFFVLDKGLTINDYRWCVPVGRIFSPQPLLFTVEQVAELLKDMESRQLLKHAESHDNEPAYRLTANLEKVCKWLLEIERFLTLKARPLKSKGHCFSLALVCGRRENTQFLLRENTSTMSVDMSTVRKSLISEYMEQAFRHIEESVWIESPEVSAACVRCSEKISGEERFCSSCGTAVASASPVKEAAPGGEQKEEQTKRICPFCGTRNQLNAQFCKECGKKINAGAVKSCPRCTRQVKEESLFCRHCGHSLTGIRPQKQSLSIPAPGKEAKDMEKQSHEQLKNCPSCKKQVRQECLFCRFCGYRFAK